MNKLSIIAAFLISLTFACRKSNNSSTTNNILPWYPSGYTIDTSGPKIVLDSFPLKNGNIWVYDNGDTIWCVSDTMLNGIACKKMVLTDSGKAPVIYYAANMADGLHQFSGEKEFPGLLVNMIPFNDSIKLYDPSVLLAHYPSDSGSSWHTMVSGTRQWLKYVSIASAAGTFNCIKMGTESEFEYYSEKGLIRTYQSLVSRGGQKTTGKIPGAITLVYVNF